jgi:transketolase
MESKPKISRDKLEQLIINTIRTLSMDAVQKANSGHPGTPMALAPVAFAIWDKFMKFNPRNPDFPNRDRFVLSNGHASMLLYSLLHLTGYDLPLGELLRFRQWESRTPGHPEYGLTPGVETTTGPLGQGFANGVGMAIAERHLAARFNRPGHEIVDHYTYGIVSDGDLMEGVSHEAASLAGHLGLGKLIYLYDDNRITIDGSTDLTFTENRLGRFRAYGWHVLEVKDGNDLTALSKAIRKAQREKNRPSLIAARTHIGYGSPNRQDTASAHGEPLGPEEIRLTKERLGWPLEPACFIPREALERFREALPKGEELERQWHERFRAYRQAFPDLALEWERSMRGDLPEGWEKALPVFAADPRGMATRVASGKVLTGLSARLPGLIGGSADLAPSNKTFVKGEAIFQKQAYDGRNFHFGVREHGMGSILNGMALHGGLIPYAGTFLVFSDYMRPAIRLAALMGLKVFYVFTHDSIGLGEDGPTHQPVEHLAALRAIPNLTVVRPCDASETAEAWRCAITHTGGPVALILSRQDVPTLDRPVFSAADGLQKGAYILREARNGNPDAILIGTGSEVPVAIQAADILEGRGVPVRVISMPSWELFEKQPRDYRDRVLPPHIELRVAVESGCTQGWHRYVGSGGGVVGLDRFGASAPYRTLYEKFGITAQAVVDKTMELRSRV